MASRNRPEQAPRATARVIRAAAAIAVVAAGGFAFANAVGLALASRAPAVALQYAPNNAMALAQAAVGRLQRSQSGTTRRATAKMALRAIRHDPSNAAALAAFAMSAPDIARATSAMKLSDQLSRRYLPTQLWLIERAVGRNDIATALRHYDIALRTSANAPAILFPILVEAVGDRALVSPVADMLATRPPWAGLYLQQLAQSGSDIHGATSLFVALIRRGVQPPPAAMDALYTRLVTLRAFEPAWTLYAATHPGARRAGIRNPSFSRTVASPAPFEWTLSDDPAVTTRFETTGSERGLSFSVATSEGGEAASQLLLLAPGRHRFEVVTGTITAADEALPYFTVTCEGLPVPLSRKPIPAGEAGRRVSWTTDVNASCPAQRVKLSLPPSTSTETAEGSIRSVSVD